MRKLAAGQPIRERASVGTLETQTHTHCSSGVGQVLELERTQRLQEIQARLDPRAEAKVRDGQLFRGGEPLRSRLIYAGTLPWKNPGSRLKGQCCVSLCVYAWLWLPVWACLWACFLQGVML